MQVNYKVEEVKSKKSKVGDAMIPVTMIVLTLSGIAVIALISYFFGVEQGKLQKTPLISFQNNPSSSSPTPTQIPPQTITPSGTKNKTSPTPSPIPKTAIITSDKNLDGFVSSNNYVNNQSEIRSGRNKFLLSRGFLSFDLSKLPKYTKIVSATLRVYQVKAIGNPYSVETGNLKIDHLIYGETLDETDYNANALSSGFTDLSKNRITGWKEVEVLNQLVEDLGSGHKTAQFRIHFEKEEKGTTDSGDYVYFESADNSEGTTNIPQLLVKYY